MTAANDLAVRRTLEMAGVEFITRTAAGRVCDYVIASGKNSPNNGPHGSPDFTKRSQFTYWKVPITLGDTSRP
jgi:hypothetical protein